MYNLIFIVAVTFTGLSAKADMISQAINEGLQQASDLEKAIIRAVAQPQHAVFVESRSRSFDSRAIIPDETETISIDIELPMRDGIDFDLPRFQEKSLELVQYEVNQANL